MNPNEQFDYLFNAFASRTCTAEERFELMQLIDSGNYDARLRELVEAKWSGDIPEQVRENESERSEAIYGRILEHAKVAKVRKITPWWRYAAAAVIIFAIAGAFWLFTGKETGQKPAHTELAQKTDVKPPAINKAVITLSNGTQIILDSAGNGTLAKQGNINIKKLSDGQIAYESTSGSSPLGEAGVGLNTLTNPRGSKVISLTLSDGSKVWLNAESSLTYPTAFAGNERKVKITGEAYFEVAHTVTAGGARQSFIVSKGDMQVTVLGTHFNIKAYDDDPDIKVTLLEGSVRVSAPSPSGEGRGEALLKPGQQAIVTHNSELRTHNSVDIDAVMAWKNGVFNFSSQDITSIMKEISRWYGSDVVYEGEKPEGKFSGIINRDNNESQVLKLLQQTGHVHFRIEGKKVVVTK